jgi:regulator of replication initiation timing
MYEIKGANKDKIERQVTGTYVPKELILDIASWISLEFYDKCNKVVINHFIKEFKKMDKTKFKNKIKEVERQMEEMTLKHDEEIKVKDDKIDQLLDSNKRLEKYVRSLGISLEEVKDQNEELLDNNKGLDKEVKKVQRKLGIAVEDRAPLPDNKKKQERFVLIKRNDPDYLPYYTIRAQNDYTNRKLRSQKALFPEMEILLDFRSNPNSKTLYVRIKDNLKAKGVTFEGNNIDLNEAIAEEELIDEMKVINDQKYEI